ncbi:helix-turn-helix domain-containing protein [Cupriavidus campinensis]|uniref:Helix-turn-helix domain-containing protein n=1 Tax=Cupriavidus campinensis TaxID=151783 RepID=A0AAE9L109_9BURK|nr:helix-turn-helix transcriptional regulator [Cupriavidus campinensis]URF02819.1 helix-turn-helix domain-containing protein [Cupriavidus campinensis]
MSTYAERLARAMSLRGMSPHTDQSELARRVGMGCKPQNIQHLLDPNKNAKSSKYTPRIAEVLQIDPQWLSYETGNPPMAGPDAVFASPEGATVPVQAKWQQEGSDNLQEMQRRHAEAILSRLNGSDLTKALAFLQELDTPAQMGLSTGPGGGVVIEGGQPDPVPESTKRRMRR